MFKFSFWSFGAFPDFDDLVSTFDLNIQGSLYCFSLYIAGILLTSKWPTSGVSRPLGLWLRLWCDAVRDQTPASHTRTDALYAMLRGGGAI